MTKTFSIIISFIGLFVGTAKAEVPVNLVYEPHALVELCPKDLLGCETTVLIGDKSYKLSALGDVEPLIVAQAQNTMEEFSYLCAEAVGFFLTQTGQYPNPHAEIEVFKVVKLRLYEPLGDDHSCGP